MLEITGNDIALLSDADLRDLVGLLCEAEVRRRGFSTSSVRWGGHQDAADAGLDVRVELPAGSQIDGWVPRSETGFQVKKRKMRRQNILTEMRPRGALRPAIKGLADRSGAYIIVTSQDSTTSSALENRLRAMAQAVGRIGNAKALKLDLYDSGRIATWVRDHLDLVLWVREKIGRPLKGWRPYGAWADASEILSGEYLWDDKLRIHTTARQSPDGVPALAGLSLIRERLRQPGTVIRLVGLSGVGKTRLAKTLFEKGVGDSNLDPAVALYANVADSPDPQPTELASQLIAAKRRAIFVIDNCPSALHRRLSEVCRSPESTVSVITVEYDIQDDLPEATEVLRLDTSSLELIEKLIHRRFPNVSQIDAGTIAKFSDGNARVAIALAGTVDQGDTITGLRDQDLLERLIWQRHLPDQSLLLAAQACSLVYSFDGEDVGGDSELARLGALVQQSAQEMYRHVAELLDRGLVQRRGVWRAVLPHAVANRLAAGALERIPSPVIRARLVDGAPERLTAHFARRLGYLHTSTKAGEIVLGWLEAGGLLGDIVALNDVQRTILDNVAPVAPEAALRALERGLLPVSDPGALRRCLDYVNVLRSLAYEADLFPRCIALLAKIAGAGDLSGSSNHAFKAFTSLFQLYFSGTLTPIEQRLEIIKALLASGTKEERTLALKALTAALEAWHFQPFCDFEFGARSRDYGYWPRSASDVRHWFGLTLELSVNLACSDEPLAPDVRGIIANQLRGMWTGAETYDELETACRTISEKQFWPQGWAAVRQIQHYDARGLAPEISARLASIESGLRPRGVIQEVRAIVLSEGVSGMYVLDIEDGVTDDVGTRMAELETTALGLGRLIAADQRALDEVLPELMGCSSRLWSFGIGLAQGAADPQEIWNRLVGGLPAIPEGQLEISVLSGFLSALRDANPSLAEVLLDLASQDERAAARLPALQAAVGLDRRGVGRLMRSLSLDLTPIENCRALVSGGVTGSVPAPEFRALILEIASKQGGFAVAADVLHMRLHNDERRKRAHEPAVIQAGLDLLLGAPPFTVTQNDSLDYALGIISSSCLRGPEGVAAVRGVCSRLKAAASEHSAYAFYYFNDLIGGLFAARPTAALDALCGGDLSELARGVRMIGALRENPLDAMPVAELLDWCEREPNARYPAIAHAISICRGTKEGDPRQWSDLALGLLERAPNRAAVFEQYVARMGSWGWRGSHADSLESRARLVDELPLYSDSGLERAVAQEKERLRHLIETERRVEAAAHRARDERFE